jgi:hypothetical protein
MSISAALHQYDQCTGREAACAAVERSRTPTEAGALAGTLVAFKPDEIPNHLTP